MRCIAGILGQVTPDGYYNVERMLTYVLKRGGEVKTCGKHAEPRGIDKLQLQEGIQLGTMGEFAQWTVHVIKS